MEELRQQKAHSCIFDMVFVINVCIKLDVIEYAADLYGAQKGT